MMSRSMIAVTSAPPSPGTTYACSTATEPPRTNRSSPQQDAEPEARQRDEHDRHEARDRVEPAVRADRARDARGQAHQPRDDEGEKRDLRRQRTAMEDQIPHRVAAEERFAELSRGDVVQPAHVLEGQRIAEPEI